MEGKTLHKSKPPPEVAAHTHWLQTLKNIYAITNSYCSKNTHDFCTKQNRLAIKNTQLASCQLAQFLSCSPWFSSCSVWERRQYSKSEGCGWRRKRGIGEWRTERKVEESRSQRNKSKQGDFFFYQMSLRPDTNGAAATCIITLRTRDGPAAPTLHSRWQRDFLHEAFKRDY